ncbi:MAG: tetratricopeptide repeat protein [Bryobacteraceae bacterium]
MTRHELKEQLQHDAFTDNVSGVLRYASLHREKLTRWMIAAGAVLILVGIVLWYSSYRREQRRNDLQAAFAVYEAPVATGTSGVGKSFATQDEKNKASVKAFGEVAAKYSGDEEGLIARYYVGTLKAQAGDAKGAEVDLRAVASSGAECSALAKIALSQLLSGQNRQSEAQTLLREVVNKPTDLVSKAQAQVLLAQSLESTNPAEAKKLLQSLKAPNQSPAVTRAIEQLASQTK